jgi:hypothetical protein
LLPISNFLISKFVYFFYIFNGGHINCRFHIVDNPPMVFIIDGKFDNFAGLFIIVCSYLSIHDLFPF